MPNLYGYAGIKYTLAGEAHQSVVMLKSGTNPLTDIVPIRAELETLASLIAVAMIDGTVISDYVVYSKDHVLLFSGPLVSEYVGSRGVSAEYPLYHSATVTLTGKGVPLSDTVAGGNALLRWVCSGYFGHLAGLKRLVVPSFVSLQNIAEFLASTDYIWADYYGTTPTVRGTAPVQFNAALQRRLGS